MAVEKSTICILIVKIIILICYAVCMETVYVIH